MFWLTLYVTQNGDERFPTPRCVRFERVILGPCEVTHEPRAGDRLTCEYRLLAVLGWVEDAIDDGVDGPFEEGVVDGLAGEQQA